MPVERLEMRRVREILRYRFEQGLGVSHRNRHLDGQQPKEALGEGWQG